MAAIRWTLQAAIDLDLRTRGERRERESIVERMESLTPREREVMDLVVAGNPNKKIARAMSISQRTVEIHRARVMEKMEVRSLSALVQAVLKAND